MTKNIFMSIKKVFIPVTVICLIAVAIFRWQGQSQAHTLVQEPPRGMTAMIEKLKNDGMQFPTYELTHEQVPLRNVVSQDDLKRGEVFNLNDLTVSMMASSLNQTLALRIPHPLSKDKSVELELAMVDILAEGFRVKTASSNGQPIEVQSGKHYRGAVKGVTGSIAAISVFNNEVSGIFNIPEVGKFVLGKLGGDNPGNLHILYPSSDLEIDRSLKCETKDKKNDVEKLKVENKTNAKATDTERSINIFLEVDNDVYTARGSLAGTVNMAQALFNQSATMFANEGISVKLSDMFVWDSKSPYRATTLNGILDQFKKHRKSSNSSLGQLISLHVDGGIASVDTTPNSNIANRKSYSHVQKNVKNIPANSLSVESFTHQLGHLIGLSHKGSEIADDEANLDFASLPATATQNKLNSAVSMISSSGCIATADPSFETFTEYGGSRRFWVNAPEGCQWEVLEHVNWIKITSARTGVGVKAIDYTVEFNAFEPREGTAMAIYTSGERTGSVYVKQDGVNLRERITNGGFESGKSPWAFWLSAFRSTGSVPHSGKAYAIIADGNNEKGYIYQDITIPVNHYYAELSLWLSISSEEPSNVAYDYIWVQVYDTSGKYLENLGTFSNKDKGNGSYSLKKCDLNHYRGQKIRIFIIALNNGSRPTKFRVDDISVR